MSDIQQISDDLHFVRAAVARREPYDRGPALLPILWAIYVIVGYTLIDFAPAASGWFFAIAGLAGGILSWYLGKRYAKRTGERDRAIGLRALGHFGGGIVIAWIFTMGLATVIPGLRGNHGGQVFVVMIGLVYFLWGIHYQRYFMFLGPVVMLGGTLVGLVPYYGWTALGAIISLGLVLPMLIPSRAGRQLDGPAQRPAPQ